MYRIGQRVTVLVGGSVGTVEKVSTWAKEHDMLSDNTPCYFVRCKEWDAGTNGGRWLGEYSLAPIVENDDVP